MSAANRYLAVFDLDETLLRGLTVCEVLADFLGKLPRMHELESCIAQGDLVTARLEMARWYAGLPMQELLRPLPRATLAPGTREGIARLQRHGVEIAIASITWEFAVAWFAQQLDIAYYLGTTLEPTGEIRHIWPRDKAAWVQRLGGPRKVVMV
jgi:phosphoserine phosphatase